MLRRRLPIILVAAIGIVMGVAIAGPPNQSHTPVISVPVSVQSPTTQAPTISLP